jgi:hypothetical protein
MGGIKKVNSSLYNKVMLLFNNLITELFKKKFFINAAFWFDRKSMLGKSGGSLGKMD